MIYIYIIRRLYYKKEIEVVIINMWGINWGNMDGGFNRNCDYLLIEKFSIVIN